MELQISPELQAKLDRLAERQGRDAQSLVHEAVERLVGYDEWFLAAVEKGLVHVERGETLREDEVAAHIEKRLSEQRHRG